MTDHDRVGSAAWLDETDGILTRRERAHLVTRLLFRVAPVALLGRLRSEVWRRTPTRARGVDPDLHTLLDLPTSHIGHEAAAMCAATLDPTLVNHSHRSWIFGRALAGADGIQLDDELFFVCAMLHDIGLASPTPGRCFTTAGVEATRLVGSPGAHDLSGAADAIAHHITPGLRRTDHLLGFYLQAGTLMDLSGTRAWDLPVAFVNEVAERHPYLDLRADIAGRWKAEAAAVRHGRAHLLERWGRFSLFARISPMPPNAGAPVSGDRGD